MSLDYGQWHLDRRHRWEFFLERLGGTTAGVHRQSNTVWYRTAFRCRACGIVAA